MLNLVLKCGITGRTSLKKFLPYRFLAFSTQNPDKAVWPDKDTTYVRLGDKLQQLHLNYSCFFISSCSSRFVCYLRLDQIPAFWRKLALAESCPASRKPREIRFAPHSTIVLGSPRRLQTPCTSTEVARSCPHMRTPHFRPVGETRTRLHAPWL
jgi:hypothetical protein